MRIIIHIICALFFFSGSILQAEFQVRLPKRHQDSLHRWLNFANHELSMRSKVKQTSVGPIEYIKQGKGPVVLALHGVFGGYDQGLLIASHLIKDGYTVLSPSRPGYLRTPISVGQTIEQQADALVALLDALKIDKVAVLGFSAGGPVAFQFALRHPERVWGLILESIGANPADAPIYTIFNSFFSVGDVPEIGPWDLFKATRYYPRTMVRELLPQDNNLLTPSLEKRIQHVLKNSDQRKFLQNIVYTAIPFSQRRTGVINDISGTDPWLSFPLSSLHIPTIIIQGVFDSNNAYSEAQSISQQIPNAELVSVKGTGHFIWLGKNTQAWQKRLSKFLKKNRQ